LQQKRAREDSWTRTAPYSNSTTDPEFKAAWSKCKPLNDHDLEIFKKLAAKVDIDC
jgi:CTD kinase subunit gamma CTK3 C-terminus